MTPEPQAVPLLTATDVVMEFPGVRALDGVSFALRPGEVHALVGENGAGKSTLVKILAGVHPHGSFRGRLELAGQPARFTGTAAAGAAGIAVIHQELMLVEQLTVAENIFLGDEPRRGPWLDWPRMVAETAAILDRFELDLDPRLEVGRLGVGARQLVEIARALRHDRRILILDEPTAALAEHEVELLMRLIRDLRGHGVALLYISHKLDEVQAIADRITVLRDGRSVASRPAAAWTRAEIVDAMVGRPLTEMYPRAPRQAGEVLMRVRGLAVADPDRPGRHLLRGIDFDLHAGEILGIAGLMGAGRTELLHSLFGDAPGPRAGTVEIAGEVTPASPRGAIGAGLALVPEDRKLKGLALDFSVLQNLTMARLDRFCRFGVVDALRELAAARRVAADVDIRAPSLFVPAATLSGGNQQKTVMGKWLIERPRILLLDEPTRGIDVGAKAEIFRLLAGLVAAGIGVIMVSSELPELLGVAHRILVLRGGRLTGEFDPQTSTQNDIMAVAT